MGLISLTENASSHDDFALRIDDHEIASSDSLKILGVTFDNTIDFSKHISDICIKCSQKVGVIMRLRKLIPTTAKLQLYKSAILPHLTYCHLVWNFCKASDRKKLERVQEKALKAVFNTNNLTYNEHLVEPNFLHYIIEGFKISQF